MLLSEYGPQHWWPAESSFEVCVGAILTQNTSWKNVENAIAQLKKHGKLSCRSLASIPLSELEPLIRASGYYRQKAIRLKKFCQYVETRYHGDVGKLMDQSLDSCRDELLSLHGIGPETADSMLLYAGNKPSFVIDAYTFRFNEAFQLFVLREPPGRKQYVELKHCFECRLPRDEKLFNEFHALIVMWGKRNPKRHSSQP
ncbi:endonuclease III domain-containing protein [Candidatus Micrarchaeota archaeon]|nr:endonuclease III domain-containing protein [Candidatus Micrarchaeota archaeon]